MATTVYAYSIMETRPNTSTLWFKDWILSGDQVIYLPQENEMLEYLASKGIGYRQSAYNANMLQHSYIHADQHTLMTEMAFCQTQWPDLQKAKADYNLSKKIMTVISISPTNPTFYK